jgi:excisionase family DNA binding protein
MEPCSAIENGYWDIRDLSNYLKVKMKTLYALVPEIPHYRVGKLIRFRKQEIDSWMEHKRGMACGQGVTSGNHRVKRPGNGHADIDKLIRKAIDQSKGEAYNPYHGKSDRIKGPTKETKHGSL